MPESILSALITGLVSLGGVVLTISRSNKDLYAKLDKQSETADLKLQAKLETFQAVTNEKLDALSRRVDENNHVKERTTAAEKRIEVLEERQKTANHRIDDLEKTRN